MVLGLGQEQAGIMMHFLPGNAFIGNVFPENDGG